VERPRVELAISRSQARATETSEAVLCVVVVSGVTQLHDIVYIVYVRSSTIRRFRATTHQRLADIEVKNLWDPRDIVACEQTSRLYVANNEVDLWRVSVLSEDGADSSSELKIVIKRWPPKSPSDTLRPFTLSVTSTRLLVTSRTTKQLTQFDPDGDELGAIRLPEDMVPEHAVESPTGTFIISHDSPQPNQYQVD